MTKIMYKKAVEYSNKGWIIHPLHSPTDESITKKARGKKPHLMEYNLLTKPLSKPELNKWLYDSENNIGVVTGKYSDITVIDFDSYKFRDDLFSGVDINTLHDERISTRGHYYFKYNNIKSIKLHELGIEILNDGLNCVIAPSIHRKGQTYKFIDDNISLQEFPLKVIENLNHLITIKHELYSKICLCRMWLRSIWKINTDKTTKKIDRINCHDEHVMLASVIELIYKGANRKHIQMFCRIMLPHDFDISKTNYKYDVVLRNIKQKGVKPYKNETLRETLPANLVQYVKNDVGRMYNPQAADYEAVNRTGYLKKDYRVVDKGHIINFHDLENNKIAYKLRREGQIVFDDNYRNEGRTVEVDEFNSPLYIYYLMTLKVGLALGDRWVNTSKTCQSRIYKRMSYDLDSNNWNTEQFIVCRTVDKHGKKTIINEYIPKILHPSMKRAKIRALYQKGIDIASLQTLFGYKSFEGVRKLVKDIIKLKKSKCLMCSNVIHT